MKNFQPARLRRVAETLDVVLDFGWSSASALQQLPFFRYGFSR
jgi:hypothetical protein